MNKEEKTPLLETINLKKYFKTGSGLLHAVDSINLKLYRGETIGVVGESGCGKSTLGRTILKLIEPTSGEIIFEGKNISKLGTRGMRNLRKEMQIIFQDPYSSLDPRKTVIDIISEYMLINHIYHSKKEAYNRAAELMDLVGLARRYAEAYPHELDGGRRQRIGVARALSLNPKFIVCDEPVSALDVSIQAQILNLLMDLQDELNLSYMFVTHDLPSVDKGTHGLQRPICFCTLLSSLTVAPLRLAHSPRAEANIFSANFLGTWRLEISAQARPQDESLLDVSLRREQSMR